MYNIILTALSLMFVYIGATNVSGGYLWVFALVVGGFYLGHVVTVALNETSEE